MQASQAMQCQPSQSGSMNSNHHMNIEGFRQSTAPLSKQQQPQHNQHLPNQPLQHSQEFGARFIPRHHTTGLSSQNGSNNPAKGPANLFSSSLQSLQHPHHQQNHQLNEISLDSAPKQLQMIRGQADFQKNYDLRNPGQQQQQQLTSQYNKQQHVQQNHLQQSQQFQSSNNRAQQGQSQTQLIRNEAFLTSSGSLTFENSNNMRGQGMHPLTLNANNSRNNSNISLTSLHRSNNGGTACMPNGSSGASNTGELRDLQQERINAKQLLSSGKMFGQAAGAGNAMSTHNTCQSMDESSCSPAQIRDDRFNFHRHRENSKFSRQNSEDQNKKITQSINELEGEWNKIKKSHNLDNRSSSPYQNTSSNVNRMNSASLTRQPLVLPNGTVVGGNQQSMQSLKLTDSFQLWNQNALSHEEDHILSNQQLELRYKTPSGSKRNSDVSSKRVKTQGDQCSSSSLSLTSSIQTSSQVGTAILTNNNNNNSTTTSSSNNLQSTPTRKYKELCPMKKTSSIITKSIPLSKINLDLMRTNSYSSRSNNDSNSNALQKSQQNTQATSQSTSSLLQHNNKTNQSNSSSTGITVPSTSSTFSRIQDKYSNVHKLKMRSLHQHQNPVHTEPNTSINQQQLSQQQFYHSPAATATAAGLYTQTSSSSFCMDQSNDADISLFQKRREGSQHSYTPGSQTDFGFQQRFDSNMNNNHPQSMMQNEDIYTFNSQSSANKSTSHIRQSNSNQFLPSSSFVTTSSNSFIQRQSPYVKQTNESQPQFDQHPAQQQHQQQINPIQQQQQQQQQQQIRPTFYSTHSSHGPQINVQRPQIQQYPIGSANLTTVSSHETLPQTKTTHINTPNQSVGMHPSQGSTYQLSQKNAFPQQQNVVPAQSRMLNPPSVQTEQLQYPIPQNNYSNTKSNNISTSTPSQLYQHQAYFMSSSPQQQQQHPPSSQFVVHQEVKVNAQEKSIIQAVRASPIKKMIGDFSHSTTVSGAAAAQPTKSHEPVNLVSSSSSRLGRKEVHPGSHAPSSKVSRMNVARISLNDDEDTGFLSGFHTTIVADGDNHLQSRTSIPPSAPSSVKTANAQIISKDFLAQLNNNPQQLESISNAISKQQQQQHLPYQNGGQQQQQLQVQITTTQSPRQYPVFMNSNYSSNPGDQQQHFNQTASRIEDQTHYKFFQSTESQNGGSTNNIAVLTLTQGVHEHEAVKRGGNQTQLQGESNWQSSNSIGVESHTSKDRIQLPLYKTNHQFSTPINQRKIQSNTMNGKLNDSACRNTASTTSGVGGSQSAAFSKSAQENHYLSHIASSNQSQQGSELNKRGIGKVISNTLKRLTITPTSAPTPPMAPSSSCTDTINGNTRNASYTNNGNGIVLRNLISSHQGNQAMEVLIGPTAAATPSQLTVKQTPTSLNGVKIPPTSYNFTSQSPLLKKVY